ncbi:MAG: DM13 domain-containing protein [Jatrophihabitans sp.]|uniref:DM13 domain-containing protein n=1 Tax=Jatrophihabitans sp. TaxID=1932789 RepID=UPI003F7D234E
MRRRTLVLLVAAAVLIPVGAWAAYWFQPWKLLTNDTVHDRLPAVAAADVTTPSTPASRPVGRPAAPPATRDTLLARGRLISHEHDTSGTVSVVRLADGRRVLAIADLDTSEGPDVHVWLTDQRVTPGGWRVFDDGWHVDLGGLKGNHGDLVYAIPRDVDLGRARSVTIWCDRFDVSFGAAALVRVG